MDNQKQIIEKLKQANNVLVTVSKDPTVDQLAALLGLSLALTKLDKHAAAVYSGRTPSTIEFLQPEDTFETNTDSLRDFIISLDKSKADKLRYKVEDEVVRIFITPYRTSISDADLDFSQGDFNVDVVVALGVLNQQDLDQAIETHGRIFHDATVVTINTDQQSDLGALNWHNPDASSVSEMTTAIVNGLGKDVLDEQIATALLTGIVAETDRFSNEKTTANTMKASAALMAAGANQQLVATQLEESERVDEAESFSYDNEPEEPEQHEQEQVPEREPTEEPEPESHYAKDNGTLQIDHSDDEQNYREEHEEPEEPMAELPAPVGEFIEPEPRDMFEALDHPEQAEEAPVERRDEEERPPTPGLTITPNPDKSFEDELLPPPENPDDLPKIGKVHASGESAEDLPKITQEHPGHHQLMREEPTFTAYDTNVDTEREEDSVNPLDEPGLEEHYEFDYEDYPKKDNSFVVGSKPEEKILDGTKPKEKEHEDSQIKVVPPPDETQGRTSIPHSKPEHHDREKHHDNPSHTHFTPKPGETLAEIEQEINSPYAHLSPYDELDMQALTHPEDPTKPAVTLDSARDAVAQAMASDTTPARPEPIIALNAQPLGAPLHEDLHAPEDNLPQFTPQPIPTPVSVPAPIPVPPVPVFTPAPAPQAPTLTTPAPVPSFPVAPPLPPAPIPPTPAQPEFKPSTDVPFDLPSPAMAPSVAPSPAPVQPAAPSAPASTAPPVPPPIMPPFPQ